jgi:acetyl-CoA carboxylase carboxyltransferase component
LSTSTRCWPPGSKDKITATGEPAAEAGRAELARRRSLAAGAGRRDRITRQHLYGLMTGRERIEALVDQGSLRLMGELVHSEDIEDADRTIGGDGAIHAFATIGGRPVAVHASDPTIKGATAGAGTERIRRAHERLADRLGLPVFDLQQSGGMRITDVMTSRFAGVPGGGGFGSYHARPRRSALLAAILGDYFPQWSMVQADFAVMTRSARAALTSPALLEAATGQRVSADELGGSDVHSRITGYVDAVVDTELQAIVALRRMFGYLPGSPLEQPPRIEPDDPADRIDAGLRSVLPANPKAPFDIRAIINRVVDRGSFFELAPDFAPNLVAGMARLDGATVMVLANQSTCLAGVLDTNAVHKLTRYLELCATYNIGMVSFIDTPGALTTKEQEHARIVHDLYRAAATRLRTRIPKVAVAVRKGNGFAFFGMGGGDLEGLTLAWPSARLAFTGPEAAASVLFWRQLAEAKDPAALRQVKADEMRELAAPWLGASLGYLDGVIDPAETRPQVIKALACLRDRAR